MMTKILIAIAFLVLLEEGSSESVRRWSYNRKVNNVLTLQKHNKYRKMLGVPSLLASDELAEHARECVKQMLFRDQDASTHPCKPQEQNEGENIYELTKGRYDVNSSRGYFLIAIKKWYDEVNYINFTNSDWFLTLNVNDPQKPIGHFTQLVWKSTKAVGCAYGFRNSLELGSTVKPSKLLVVCRYSPPGNTFTGLKIKENVPVPPSKKFKKVKQCKDDADYCKTLPCESMFPQFKSKCRASCGLC